MLFLSSKMFLCMLRKEKNCKFRTIFEISINSKSKKLEEKKTKLEFKGMWSLPQTLIFYNVHNC